MAKAVMTEYTVASERVRSPLKIALVSDLHERRAVDILNLLREAKPDMIAVAGDTFERYDTDVYVPRVVKRRSFCRRVFLNVVCYVNYALTFVFGRRNQPKAENAYSFLRQASNIAPVFLSTGNHELEFMPKDYDFFKRYNIHLLDNEDMETAVNNNFMIVGGLSTAPDEAWLYRFSQKDGLRVLLNHHPEYYDDLIKNTDIDLILSGHNHGGQIRIFGKGIAGSGGKIFPKYDKGLYDGRMVVSAGCSNTAAIPRWGNPRELVLIHLIKNEKKA